MGPQNRKKSMTLKNLVPSFFICVVGFVWSASDVTAEVKRPAPDLKAYRDLTLRIRKQGQFKASTLGQEKIITYSFKFSQPVYDNPKTADLIPDFEHPERFFRTFIDRIMVGDGSFLNIAGERLPLTCVYVHGQDNRHSGINSPVIPKIIMKIILVANDYACQGPIKPGWPETGGREENWDSYLTFQVKDPTIMLPVDAILRYQWNEFAVVLVDAGPKHPYIDRD
jgi:hypothetical protein